MKPDHFQPPGIFRDLAADVKARRAGRNELETAGDAGDVHTGERMVLHRKTHIEDRVAPAGGACPDRRGKFGKRHGVGEVVDHFAVQPDQHGIKGLPGIELPAERHVPREVSHGLAGGGFAAAGHGRPDNDVRFARPTEQRGAEGGEKDGKKRGAFAFGQVAQRVGLHAGNFGVAAGKLPGPRSFTVAEEKFRALEPRPPVVDVLFEFGRRPLRALGGRPLGVGHFQRRKFKTHGPEARHVVTRFLPGQQASDGKITHEIAERPAVGNRVVDGERQCVVVGTALEHFDPAERTAQQVDRAGETFLHLAGHPVVAGGSGWQLAVSKLRFGLGADNLERPFLARNKSGAQRIMTPHHMTQRLRAHGMRQRSADVQETANVVRGIAGGNSRRLPQFSLGERQRLQTGLSRRQPFFELGTRAGFHPPPIPWSPRRRFGRSLSRVRPKEVRPARPHQVRRS